MKKKYYVYGERPIFSEEKPKGIVRYYAFQWNTGEFEEDIRYRLKLFHDTSGEGKEITKEEFDTYVKEIKDRKGLK
ncbi:MAG: hypothetical protein K1X55_08920 [Chitinophagales bacterium]|nr:hypothetical protein [Chitinophagales bacterium]